MDRKALNEAEMLRLMSALDCFTWVTHNGLELSHGPWELEDHEYQAGWLQENHPRQCFIKGAQIGATEALVLKTLHGLIHSHYSSGALYLFPTRDDVRDFSKARFDPLIDSNPFIGAYVQHGPDSQNIKKIGKGFLYLRGARSTKQIRGKKSSSQLKSIPVDRVVFDEMDEIEPEMVQLAKERISHSKVQELMYLGTPTIPDYGIDAMYQQSDQRVWMITCEHCGKESCLDLEFPDCLMRRPDESVYRGCIHCKGEIHPRNGKWVAQYASKGKDLVGWWISQLNSARIDPAYILSLYEDPPNGDLSEVMNSKLGRAYIPSENKLTEQDVYAIMKQDPMKSSDEGPTCMGVDVGRKLHVVISHKIAHDTLKVIKVGRYDSFNDLHDLAHMFNVRSTVIDLRPETRKVREFQRTENHQVFGCEYIEARAGSVSWNEKERIVQVNRTEICDATHELVVEPGRLVLPRRNEEMNQFAKEMCGIAKILIEDSETGSKTFKYVKLSGRADHYRHAMNYCYLASERIGTINDKNIIGRFFSKRRKRSWMSA
jgi:hypothetical protein